MDKIFYTLLVEGVEDNKAFVQVFWTYANHLGEAIDSVLSFTKQLRIEKPYIAEVDPYDFETLPSNIIKDNNAGIYYKDERYLFPIEDYAGFHLPYGVVQSCVEGELEIDDIREGYTSYISQDGIKHLEVVVDGQHLFELYKRIIRQIPTISVFWLRLALDWDVNNITEIYTNETLTNIQVIDKFIRDNIADTLLNGFVNITVYSNDGDTNYNLDEHKKIHISTTSDLVIKKNEKFLESIGYKKYKMKNFISIEFEFHHWHYRPTSSKNRKKLIEHLVENGFKLWKTQ